MMGLGGISPLFDGLADELRENMDRLHHGTSRIITVMEEVRDKLPNDSLPQLDHRWLTNSAAASAAGVAVVSVGSPPLGTYWIVERGAFTVPAPVGSRQNVFSGTRDAAGLRDSFNMNQGFADHSDGPQLSRFYQPPLFIPQGLELITEFNVQTAGDVCTVNYQVRQLPVP